ncbi:MAG: hypothetical protein LC115_08735 [Bacteroidia bacterium]|nr:hypothetical protein [Bacteroidia bacterium]
MEVATTATSRAAATICLKKRIMCRSALIIVMLLQVTQLFAVAPADSTENKHKIRFLIGLDARNSFVADQKARIGGIRMGLELNKKYRFGLGIYGTEPPVTKAVHVYIPHKSDPVHVSATIRLNYFAAFFEYVWYQSKHWELSTPLIAGLGTISVKAIRLDLPNDPPQQFKGITLLGEAAITGHYKIFPWIGIGGGIGYRKLLASPLVSKNFDSFIYILKIKIFPKPIYDAILSKNKKESTAK